MSEIKLQQRYPNSRHEDIIDAFMRGYVSAVETSMKLLKEQVAENAKLRKENDTLTRRIDELCMENEQLRNQRTARRIVVSESGVGHAECSACGGAIDQDDAWCRHCGAKLEDTDG